MFGRKKDERKAKKEFVDLNDHSASMYAPSDARVKVVEMTSYRDLKALTDMAYRGNILILDFSRFAEGDAAKKDIAKHLLDVAKDIDGAFTEVSDRLMVLSPSGLSIDKCRITYKEK
ncbi:MAG: cell division protein SepF [Methanomassiliicoccaceae archaeon]|nr:cell division protein SepF [Methanomassiliicoccaceae archaeon]